MARRLLNRLVNKSTTHALGSIWDHVEELRQTLIRVALIVLAGCLLCFALYDQVLALLTIPLANVGTADQLLILGPIEGFQTALRTCFWCGLTVTSPIWIFALLRFIHPGLRESERRLIVPFLATSGVFISLGILFAYFVTIPLANHYLYAFNSSIGQNQWTLQNYLDYTVLLLLANALAFEVAVAMLFLVHSGWLSAAWLRDKRRLMIVLIFILSAILTPPDVLTQLLLAFPLMALYELLMIYADWRERARRRLPDPTID